MIGPSGRSITLEEIKIAVKQARTSDHLEDITEQQQQDLRALTRLIGTDANFRAQKDAVGLIAHATTRLYLLSGDIRIRTLFTTHFKALREVMPDNLALVSTHNKNTVAKLTSFALLAFRSPWFQKIMQEHKPLLLEELKLERSLEMRLNLGDVSRPLDVWLSVLEKKDLSAQPLIEAFLLGHHLEQLERCLTELHPSEEDFQAIMKVFKALCEASEFLKVDEAATKELARGIELIYYRHEAFRPQIDILLNRFLRVVIDYFPHEVNLRLTDGEIKTSALFLSRLPIFFKLFTGPFLERQLFESKQSTVNFDFGAGDVTHLNAVLYFLKYNHFPDAEIDALQMILLGDELGVESDRFYRPFIEAIQRGMDKSNAMEWFQTLDSVVMPRLNELRIQAVRILLNSPASEGWFALAPRERTALHALAEPDLQNCFNQLFSIGDTQLFKLLEQVDSNTDAVLFRALGDQVVYRLNGWLRDLDDPAKQGSAQKALSKFLSHRPLISRYHRLDFNGLSQSQTLWLKSVIR